jgi:hypothetical protein
MIATRKNVGLLALVWAGFSFASYPAHFFFPVARPAGLEVKETPFSIQLAKEVSRCRDQICGG